MFVVLLQHQPVLSAKINCSVSVTICYPKLKEKKNIHAEQQQLEKSVETADRSVYALCGVNSTRNSQYGWGILFKLQQV
jgi:hypothetical protein